MRRLNRYSLGRLVRCPLATGLVLAAILVGAMGPSCDSTAAREAAAQSLADGVKAIFGSLVDGLVAGVWGIDLTSGS